MPNGQDLVSRLRDHRMSPQQRGEAIHEFQRATGWRPSYEIDYPETKKIACGHLLVEHGLRPVVAITFLRQSYSFDRLDWDKRGLLLSISYNNLVDWHYFPDHDGFWVAYNRTRPANLRKVTLAENPNAWMVDEFDKLVGRRPSPNLPPLDDALIGTVSHWKRILAGELNATDLTEPISELFNAIFFVRALEDQRRREKPNTRRALLAELDARKGSPLPVREILAAALLSVKPPPARSAHDLWDPNALRVFDTLDLETVRELLSDFYVNRFAPYRYDFSLISKYALSHIYEHYISRLTVTVPEEPTLFPEPAKEVPNRDIGGFYTPHYIARFFARFLEAAHSAPRFRELKVADPACGSGMFLRTLLEMQCDPLQMIDVPAVAETAFANVLGIDVQPNACKAARLSLSLLHLVLTGDFPKDLKIENAEAVDYVGRHPELAGNFGAVLANPPFVKWEKIPPGWQPKVAAYLSGYDAPKADLYIAFAKIGLDLVKPGGFLLYVLPRPFLLSRNARKLREELGRSCWVRVLADLSQVAVFDEASTYPILLILEKKREGILPEPQATVVRCTAYPGQALQEALDGREVETGYYSIYSASQALFQGSTWQVPGQGENRLHARIVRFPKLEAFLTVKQGFITGQDKVFIRNQSDVPEGESAVYVPYLPDREMRPYQVPSDTGRVVFYPFDGDRLMSGPEIKERFPQTWRYLQSQEADLKSRKSLARVGHELWWRPLWPRPPRHMLRPKIVSPHLILFPRFALDSEGRYAVSRSPVLLPRDRADDLPLLKYALGVLNSSVGHWQIIRQSHRYSRGYAMLEANTLKNFHLPSPAAVPPQTMNSIQNLVDLLIGNPSDVAAQRELDRLVADVYGVTPGDVSVISDRESRHGR
jgi:hypothetical protein